MLRKFLIIQMLTGGYKIVNPESEKGRKKVIQQGSPFKCVLDCSTIYDKLKLITIHFWRYHEE